MNKIKTKCENCVYNLDSKCRFDFPVFNEDDKIYTEGFCRYKRRSEFRTKQEVLKEELKLTLILNCGYKEFDHVVNWLQNTDLSNIDQIIMYSFNQNLIELQKELFNVICDLGKLWHFKIYLEDEHEFIAKWDTLPIMAHNWFYFSRIDCDINQKLIDEFKNNTEQNMFYFKDESDLIINKFAFMEMVCSNNELFEKTLKELEQYE